MNNKVKIIKTKEQRKAENLAKIPEFTLMNDTFMNVFFNEQPELAQFIIRIILNREDIFVKHSVTQKPLKNLQGRSLTLDIYAVFENGSEADIEIQNDSGDAHPKRARLHSSMIDSNALVQDEDFENLPETYVIFITAKDYFKKGLPIYTVDRYIRETDMTLFGDDEHIIYVNGEYTDNTPIGKLIHDFKCKNPSDMYYKKLAERASVLKETEGGKKIMCDIMEKLCEDYAMGKAIENATSMILDKLPLEKVAKYSGLTLEEVKELAEELKSVNA